jgi:hypothetical protein
MIRDLRRRLEGTVAARLTAKARAAGKVAVQERVRNSAVQVARLLEAASILSTQAPSCREAASAVKNGLNACRGQPEFLSQRKRQNPISAR